MIFSLLLLAHYFKALSFLDDFEDLTIFTEGEFSDRGSVTSGTAQYAQISGLFDLRSETMFDSLGRFSSTSEGRKITFRIETAKSTGLHHRDKIVIKGQNYEIIGINPDHDGKLTELDLKETAFVSPTTGGDLTEAAVTGQTVGEAVAQFRIVYRINDLLYLADATDVDRVRAIGAMQQNVVANGQGSVKYAGYIKNDSWNFDTNKGLFLGAEGKIVQTPLTNAVAVVDLGVVISATEILLDISDPIYL